MSRSWNNLSASSDKVDKDQSRERGLREEGEEGEEGEERRAGADVVIGKYNKVGLLAGTNHDEQAFQTCMYYPNLTADKYNGTLSGLFRGYYLNVARVSR